MAKRKQPDFDYITVEMCRASGCASGAKTADIQGYYREIVGSEMGQVNDRGDIKLI